MLVEGVGTSPLAADGLPNTVPPASLETTGSAAKSLR
jgi:hypothetical protein